MPGGDVHTLAAATEGVRTVHWITAAVIFGVAVLLAVGVDRAFQRRGRRLAEALAPGGMSRGVDTRLSFVRRLVTAAILLIGIALSLNEFSGINRFATSVLASGAIAAAIVGFAARQTLANFVAGIMLAITQPLRIGDWVTFEEVHGRVEDVRLNYTILRTSGEQRVVVPNERLAGGILRNDTLVVDAVDVSVDVWVAADADVERAMEALDAETGGQVTVAEATTDGIRLTVGGERVAPADKGAHEADLRAACVRRLHAEGLLPA